MTQTTPAQTTHWSCRRMSEICGVSKASVQSEPMAIALPTAPAIMKSGRNGEATGAPTKHFAWAYEYEDWRRGRIFDRERDLFVLYADRKLMTPATLARIRAHFHLPENRTPVEGDFHYQSRETPSPLT
jgi:hypothetical protein